MNKTEKKKRSIVCLLALVLLVLALLLTGCSGLGQEGAGDKRDDRDISDDQRMQEEEMLRTMQTITMRLPALGMETVMTASCSWLIWTIGSWCCLQKGKRFAYLQTRESSVC